MNDYLKFLEYVVPAVVSIRSVTRNAIPQPVSWELSARDRERLSMPRAIFSPWVMS